MSTQPLRPLKTVIWRVPTMSNQQDVGAVQRILDGLHGVALIAVDLPAHLITVEYDSDSASPAEISAFLTTAGYPVEQPS
ncbi:MAG TPA: heavy-metal-associated domain-containing protein [Chloroflexota bacterium]|nr:heavy-metal-associated domain-containing protein [Chloroflexota bacterium]